MARNFTVQQIITRAVNKADMANTDFIGTDEKLDLFNNAYTELYDLLVGSFSNYFVLEQMINVSSATTDYDLPEDYYKTIGMDWKATSNGDYVTLKPFNEMERNTITNIQGTIPTGVIRHRYVPTPPIYDDLDTEVAGISGWEEVIVVLMAIEMLSKEESDTRRLERRLLELQERIQDMSQNRDLGMPGRVNDVYSMNLYQNYQGMRYQINSDYVRFMNCEILGAPFSYL